MHVKVNPCRNLIFDVVIGTVLELDVMLCDGIGSYVRKETSKGLHAEDYPDQANPRFS
jgi:hypothetical protein